MLSASARAHAATASTAELKERFVSPLNYHNFDFCPLLSIRWWEFLQVILADREDVRAIRHSYADTRERGEENTGDNAFRTLELEKGLKCIQDLCIYISGIVRPDWSMLQKKDKGETGTEISDGANAYMRVTASKNQRKMKKMSKVWSSCKEIRRQWMKGMVQLKIPLVMIYMNVPSGV